FGGLEVDKYRHGRKQASRLQRGDVSASALPGLEHAEERKRPHAFTKRATGDAERLGQVFLDRETRPGGELTPCDHCLNLVNDDLCLRLARRRRCDPRSPCFSTHQMIIRSSTCCGHAL